MVIKKERRETKLQTLHSRNINYPKYHGEKNRRSEQQKNGNNTKILKQESKIKIQRE